MLLHVSEFLQFTSVGVCASYWVYITDRIYLLIDNMHFVSNEYKLIQNRWVILLNQDPYKLLFITDIKKQNYIDT